MSTNIKRMFDSYLDASYYYHKGDSLRINDNGVILDNGTPIAYLESKYDVHEDIYQQYLVVTLQVFKSQQSWRSHLKNIAKYAMNNLGYRVIFVPEIDMGFGVNDAELSTFVHYNQMIKLKEWFKQEPIAIVKEIINDNNEVIGNKTYYSFNQVLNDKVVYGATILSTYLSDDLYTDTYKIVSLLELDEYSSVHLLEYGTISSFTYAIANDNKSPGRLQLVNDILSKRIRNQYNKPIQYKCIKNTRVTKLYDKEKSK